MVRIGIIGCGYWGPNLVRDFYEVDDVKVVWLADLSDDRLKAIKKRYPDVATTRNSADVINDKSIDAII